MLVVVVLLSVLIKNGKSLESRDVMKMQDNELIKYRSQFEQRATLCVKAGKHGEYKKYQEKIDEITSEIARRKSDCSINVFLDINEMMLKHVKLIEVLIEKNGCTEDQANKFILNKIEHRKTQYQKKGLSEQEALEKSSLDVYQLAEK